MAGEWFLISVHRDRQTCKMYIDEPVKRNLTGSQTRLRTFGTIPMDLQWLSVILTVSHYNPLLPGGVNRCCIQWFLKLWVWFETDLTFTALSEFIEFTNCRLEPLCKSLWVCASGHQRKCLWVCSPTYRMTWYKQKMSVCVSKATNVKLMTE